MSAQIKRQLAQIVREQLPVIADRLAKQPGVERVVTHHASDTGLSIQVVVIEDDGAHGYMIRISEVQ
jgi:hypothetical protein